MAELQWVAGKVGSWFTAANWSPAKIPTAADDEIIDGASSLAEIDDATAVADSVTINAGAELEVGTGGVLDATNAITVDGFGAELLVENGGEVESANSSVLNIGGATPNSSASGELVLAGTGATIKPATVALNGGSFVARLRDDRQLHFRQRDHGSRGRGASWAGNRHLDRRRHLLRRHVR